MLHACEHFARSSCKCIDVDDVLQSSSDLKQLSDKSPEIKTKNKRHYESLLGESFEMLIFHIFCTQTPGTLNIHFSMVDSVGGFTKHPFKTGCLGMFRQVFLGLNHTP